MNRRNDLIEAILKELRQSSIDWPDFQVKSVYFGGGTPSILPPQDIERLISASMNLFETSEVMEITLEANPDDVKGSTLRQWKNSGINRLSLGIQSFRDVDLKLMNRAHNAKEAHGVASLCRSEGFNAFNIDLIYGIPGLGNTAWRENIHRAIEILPDHLSAYCLTIEPKTAFSHFIKSGQMKSPDDEVSFEHYQILCEEMAKAGYDHYEVSNFSLPGKQAQHNSSYWSRNAYLGIGPSAHSFIGNRRFWNVANNHLYINSANSRFLARESEDLNERDVVNELIMTGLRTSKGVSKSLLLQSGYPFNNAQKSAIERFKSKLWLLENEEVIIPTELGFWWSDRMSSELFWV